ncbi:hypothetical protein BJ138DRAFT_539785 [Hygrophoropsis aurantiaca]|uniref:Uncharacterized protein n=1 Tax=Hygrophoropsis aurantiaca TaxID=72124 RepID=A0ACB8ALI0_9AGAM|nr:hypothetical protein BJ138DRAFT_539785 [Hygrophoropsis aurantiaca]
MMWYMVLIFDLYKMDFRSPCKHDLGLPVPPAVRNPHVSRLGDGRRIGYDEQCHIRVTTRLRNDCLPSIWSAYGRLQLDSIFPVHVDCLLMHSESVIQRHDYDGHASRSHNIRNHLRDLFLFCCASPVQELRSPDPHSGHITLTALAVTCRTFRDPALAVRWRRLYGVRPLIHLFPGDIWLSYDPDGDQDDEALEFTRLPSEEEWIRFESYTSRIREIKICPRAFDEFDFGQPGNNRAATCPSLPPSLATLP